MTLTIQTNQLKWFAASVIKGALMLTIDVARRLRKRGLALPVEGEFENARLKDIAIRIKILLDELNRLDRELIAITAQPVFHELPEKFQKELRKKSPTVVTDDGVWHETKFVIKGGFCQVAVFNYKFVVVSPETISKFSEIKEVK